MTSPPVAILAEAAEDGQVQQDLAVQERRDVAAERGRQLGEDVRLVEGLVALVRRAVVCRFGSLSALCAHTKAPYKIDFNRKTLRALNRPGTARTSHDLRAVGLADVPRLHGGG
jgi:hypothetical protein